MIGLALIGKCIEEGTEVLAFVNPGSKRKDRIPDHPLVTVKECALADMRALCEGAASSSLVTPGTTPELPASYDTFYHLAWASTSHAGRNEVRPHIDNITYTIDAVELAAAYGCKRFIGAGSQAEYGRVAETLTPDTSANPETPYGSAKLCAGQMSRIRCEQRGIEHIWTRILSAYGPGDTDHTLISSLIRTLDAGEHFSTTAGEQIWDFIYADDAAEALYLIGERGITGETYLIASGNAKPLKEYIETAKSVIAPNASIGYGEIPYSDRQVMHLAANISELTQDTGFTPKIDFATGIRWTYEWYKNL